MPRVKIDYVVSFSSEDPENQANNILEWEVSKKKWLCSKGEPSCSIVLQLAKAVQIESINIGAHHAASVEVLVGLSEKPNEPFEVLVPTCVLLSAGEARRGAAEQRVRSFSGAQLAPARARRWDRVRVVCAQPYNRHCQYGLSFVHIHEPESSARRTFAFDALPADGDEAEFRPGELFASARRSTTDSQIRRATMDAIRNESDEHARLVKIPINKVAGRECRKDDDDSRSNRHKENLMYTDDDIKPHDKIDQVVQRHRQQRDEEKTSHSRKTGDTREKEKLKISSTDSKTNKTVTPLKHAAADSSPQDKVVGKDATPPSTSHSKKRKRSDDEPGPRAAREADVLAGVTFTLSGYENPLRAELRAVGLRLGARYLPGWRGCSHLVCAFPNTPKLREARAGGGGAAAVAAEWLRACAARRRRLPWRWFALDPRERLAPPADAALDAPDPDDGTDVDTDDEIEKVLQSQRKRSKINSPSADDAPGSPPAADVVDDARDVSRDSDVTFVRDERVRDNITLDDSDSELTDRDEPPPRPETIDAEKILPHFFEGLTFTISGDLDGEYDRALLARYIRAYGGLVVEPAAALAERAQYHVCGAAACGAGARCVRPEWVWRCHRRRALLADAR